MHLGKILLESSWFSHLLPETTACNLGEKSPAHHIFASGVSAQHKSTFVTSACTAWSKVPTHIQIKPVELIRRLHVTKPRIPMKQAC